MLFVISLTKQKYKIVRTLPDAHRSYLSNMLFPGRNKVTGKQQGANA
jgi:hypothetical protein